MDPILEQYRALEDHVRQYTPNADFDRLYAAFTYADRAHDGQLRRNGTPYITHPLAVAEIAADLELDMDSLIAALLHDCIEDTGATHEEISKLFSPTVANLVEGVTKLTRMQYTTKEEKQMENLRKMLMAMSKDIRVILIKLCDRLHNMRTMEYQTPKKQKEKSLETLEIYAPLAHRLGMQKIKWELEDLSLKFLDPAGYKDIENQLNSRASAHEEFMASIQKKIQDRMEREGVTCTVYGRVKHIYSLYRKMYTQQKSLYEIFDLYAFRVIVSDIAGCYTVLGCIHDMFNPMQGRFKDYISTPKPNGYQSLHTTVIGREGIPFEVQIRTQEMHETAEYGIAAHWKYKQGMTGREEIGSEKTFEWVRKLLEAQADTDAEEFVRTMKVDLFSDEVFVFTPNGDVISLPAGATPIDFAYSIHSAVGNHMTGAKVNGRIVPFDTQLNNGDLVEISTSKSAHGPSRDWMNICKSNEARSKIRQWFKKERREENIVNGRVSFDSELRRAGYSMAMITENDLLPVILKKLKYSTLDDMYAAIGYGGITSAKAVNRVREEMLRLRREQKEQAQQEALFQQAITPTETAMPHVSTALPAAQPEKHVTHSKTGIIVEGLDNCLVKFAKCCTPVPGDPVIGFITRGYGVSVHRQDCPNASPSKVKPEERGRWIRVSWGESEQSLYKASLEVSAKARPNLALDIAAALSACKVRVENFNARGLPDGFAMVSLVLYVEDQTKLNSVMSKLNQISGVMTVKRAAG
ncbi:MAG: bifunctional (p)ppGpp synthetase/guanosine-3',5'-bis(diphosphate) 3'-pyrophosphohydrolase [Oscillospiraceae bacterium]|nr:bifunctional (p)ppGpp synthetase/guanosine-3',5'-bis(diphosphate) 3'-pyrophosphohydrolase [Oscillospiraceae bacterium]